MPRVAEDVHERCYDTLLGSFYNIIGNIWQRTQFWCTRTSVSALRVMKTAIYLFTLPAVSHCSCCYCPSHSRISAEKSVENLEESDLRSGLGSSGSEHSSDEAELEEDDGQHSTGSR